MLSFQSTQFSFRAIGEEKVWRVKVNVGVDLCRESVLRRWLQFDGRGKKGCLRGAPWKKSDTVKPWLGVNGVNLLPGGDPWFMDSSWDFPCCATPAPMTPPAASTEAVTSSCPLMTPDEPDELPPAAAAFAAAMWGGNNWLLRVGCGSWSIGQLFVWLRSRHLFLITWIRNSASVKLKSGGSSLPAGNLVAGSLSSSKKVWAHACNGEIRAEGVYSSRRDTRSMASGEVLALKTFCQGWALIWGNLNSV